MIAQAPAVISITTTQMTVALMLSVITLVGAGVAFGRLTERQKSDHKVLNDTLSTLEKGMASITTSMNEMREQWQRAREERVDWNYWRVITDERLGDHDEKIGQLEHSHANVETRLVVFEDRRKGDPDRRQS